MHPSTAASALPAARRGWMVAAVAALACLVLGGVLPLASAGPARFVDNSAGVIYVAGLGGLLGVLALDMAIGSEIGLAFAAGTSTMVLSISTILLAVIDELSGWGDVGAGFVFLTVAAVPALVLLVAGLIRMGRRSSRPVQPALAAVCAAGAAVSAIGMLIPPSSDESFARWVWGSPALLHLALLLPVALTVVGAVLAVALRTARSVGLATGNAAGLLVVIGADQIVRSQTDAGVTDFLNGEWVMVLIGLAISIAAGVAALAVPHGRSPGDAQPSLVRRTGITPALVALGALVIIPLAVDQHGRTSQQGSGASSSGSYSINSGADGSNSYVPNTDGSGYNSSPNDASGGVPPYDTSPTSSYSPPAATAADPQTVMGDLENELAQSEGVRPYAQDALNDVTSCGGNFAADEQSIQTAISTRGTVISDLSNLDASSLPNGDQMVSTLTSAMNDSVTADQDFLAYVEDVADNTTSCNSNATSDSNYNDGLAASAQADQDKVNFVALWNPVAATYNQPTLQASDF
jgi:hypothetical protein